MNKRNTSIDILKFISAFVIAYYHILYFGYKIHEYSFSHGFILVELFFAITGYLTINHFINHPDTDIAEYNIKKFKPMIPYILIISTASFIIKNYSLIKVHDFGSILSKIINFRFAFTDAFYTAPHSFLTGTCTLWYLSILFYFLPIFCLMYKKIGIKYMFVIAWIITPLIYATYLYDKEPYGGIFPQSIIRVIGGLFLGVLVYVFSCKINESEKIKPIHIYFLETLSFVVLFYNLYSNKEALINDIILIIILLSCIFSDKSLQPKINNSFSKFLGEMSMIIYITHFISILTINYFFSTSEQKKILHLLLVTVIALTSYSLNHIFIFIKSKRA